ncbi:MAG: lysophospholipase [Actinomycetota bacterium]|nr:lysophospholipase [Actinomycetota bacterium]
MTEPTQHSLSGSGGELVFFEWPNDDASFIALIAHGYGEHARRYDHVAERLVSEGATVYAPDHLGHGLSEGERALVAQGEALTADLHLVAEIARGAHPGLPVVLIGHSMGGIVATRYAQRHPDELTALVLSGPVIGGNAAIMGLLELDPIPEIPIDPDVLSRDPETGAKYATDPLVYHGPFHRETLEMLRKAVSDIAEGGGFDDLPVLWIHGSVDALAPLEETRPAVERLRGPRTESKVYEGAKHEIFNETNRDEVLDDTMGFLRRALSESGTPLS